LWLKALKAGADLSDLSPQNIQLHHLRTKIEETVAQCGQGRLPSSLEAGLPPHPAVQSAPGEQHGIGAFKGITPIQRSYPSLAPEAQGLGEGIGRLGLISLSASTSLLKFANCGNQHVHQIEHLQRQSPGLQHCFLCQTWYLLHQEPVHDQACRAQYFGSQVLPISYQAMKLTIAPQAGGGGCDIRSSHQHFSPDNGHPGEAKLGNPRPDQDGEMSETSRRGRKGQAPAVPGIGHKIQLTHVIIYTTTAHFNESNTKLL